MRYTVIYPPVVRWDEHIFQRPHQLQLEFAKQGEFAILANAQNDGKGLHWNPHENLLVTNDLAKTLQTPSVKEKMAGTKVVFWVTFPGSMKYFDVVKPDIFVFDYIDECVDEFSHWIEGIYDCMDKSDFTVVTSERLREIVEPKYPNKTVLCRNGADVRQYFQETTVVPDDMKPLKAKYETIIGFHGSLQSWVDFDLIREVAEKRPDWGFAMVGPEYHPNSKKIHGIENVHLLGPKFYNVLNPYVSNFDVGIIPFELRDMTQSSNPIKMYEYLACGIPVVSTPLKECTDLAPYVRSGTTADEFVAAIEEALANREQEKDMYRKIAHDNSWTARVKQIIGELDKV